MKLKNHGKLNTPDFIWWIGIVENRIDPYKLGRYQVRVMGYHTGNKEALPTEDLPWATLLNPVTSASMSGIMETPNLVEGTTVVGFFSDGEDGQMPIIMGSLAGMPYEAPVEDGFADPRGIYPRRIEEGAEDEGLNVLNESDLPRLARDGEAEKHITLINKREQREVGIRTAKAPSVSEENGDAILDDKSGADYEGVTWDEPHPRGAETLEYFDPQSDEEYQAGPDFEKHNSVYPFNRVKETESGHVFEVDDTPQNGRIHEYHNAGTFREVQRDGTTVTKIVGDKYEIIAGSENVVIRGAANVTIAGDCKMLVKGNKYEEIEGDHFVSVYGDRITKINGNDIRSVITDVTEQINGNRTVRVTGDDTETVEGKQSETIGKEKSVTVTGNLLQTYSSNHTSNVAGFRMDDVVGNRTMITGGNIKSGAVGTSLFASKGDQEIKTEGNQKVTVIGSITETAASADEAYTGTHKTAAATADKVYTNGEITVATITHTQHTHQTTSMDTGDGANSGAKNASDSPNSGT